MPIDNFTKPIDRAFFNIDEVTYKRTTIPNFIREQLQSVQFPAISLPLLPPKPKPQPQK